MKSNFFYVANGAITIHLLPALNCLTVMAPALDEDVNNILN